MKLRFIIVITIAFLFFLGILFFGRVFPSLAVNNIQNTNAINFLKISEDIYYRQTLNNCAPYSVMAVINILKNEKVDPELLAKQTTWRIYKNLTYPQGVIDLLKKYKIDCKEYVLWNKNKVDKINWLKNMIDDGKPIILLIEIKHVKHYFTIIGYDKNGFIIYDSLQDKDKTNSQKTIVDKANYSGNRYYTYEKVIELWNDGGYKIFFQNLAITCTY